MIFTAFCIYNIYHWIEIFLEIEEEGMNDIESQIKIIVKLGSAIYIVDIRIIPAKTNAIRTYSTLDILSRSKKKASTIVTTG